MRLKSVLLCGRCSQRGRRDEGGRERAKYNIRDGQYT